MAIKQRLEAQEVFGFMRPEQVNTLSNAADIVDYRAGDTVYYKGEQAKNMYVVLGGEVSLRLPGKGGLTIPIDLATRGVLFGSCQCFDIDSYSTTAQCTQDSKLMKINANTLRRLMDDDLQMGYVMQRRIAGIYFRRYLETMRKLQAIVMNLPVEAEQ
jgi:CRP-like cAMP-binding protein